MYSAATLGMAWASCLWMYVLLQCIVQRPRNETRTSKGEAGPGLKHKCNDPGNDGERRGKRRAILLQCIVQRPGMKRPPAARALPRWVAMYSAATLGMKLAQMGYDLLKPTLQCIVQRPGINWQPSLRENEHLQCIVRDPGNETGKIDALEAWQKRLQCIVQRPSNEYATFVSVSINLRKINI